MARTHRTQRFADLSKLNCNLHYILGSDQIEGVRRFGIKGFYGDAGRLDLLHAARLLVLAIDDHEKANAERFPGQTAAPQPYAEAPE